MSIASEITRINTNIANAYTKISDKGGTLPATQNSANLANAIDSISGGAVEHKDIDFVDYDGTLLYSYTMQEIQDMTELPALPTQTGLTCQGWNFTLAQLKNMPKDTQVGATYTTTDGATRLHIEISDKAQKTVELRLKQTADYGIVIDWGDGSATESLAGAYAQLNPTHTYTNIGNYIISLKPQNDSQIQLGWDGSNYCVMGEVISNRTNRICSSFLREVNLGSSIRLSSSSYAFNNCYNLEKITIPENVTEIPQYFLYNCTKLKHIVFPKTLTKINSYGLMLTGILDILTLPYGLTTIQDTAVASNNFTKVVWNKASVTTFGSGVFQNCSKLEEIDLPTSVSTLPYGFLNNCRSLMRVFIPTNITSISGNAFQSCGMCHYFDLTKHTVPPTLNTSAFNGIDINAKIVVAEDYYEDFVAQSTWNSLSYHIWDNVELDWDE